MNLSAIELRELVFALARYDRVAFERLYRATMPRIHAVVQRIVRDHAIAEECTAEVYVQIWREGARYSPERGEVLAWMLNIARSRAIDLVRKRQREREEMQREQAEAIPMAVEPGRILEQFSEHTAVHAALGKLSQAQLQVVTAAFFRGESVAEIAARTTMPLGTVKSHLRRGLLKLQSMLQAAAPGSVQGESHA